MVLASTDQVQLNEPPPITADTTETAKAAYLPEKHPTGVALALSGGGSRAALFHLGVLRRLNEVGVLSQIDTISSVSGGSILAGLLAAHVGAWPARGETIPDFDATVVAALARLVRRNIRTPPIARRWVCPRNWFNDQASIEALIALFDTYVNGGRLADMAESAPRFIFCASDNAFGVNWTSTRQHIGDYKAGYWSPADWTVGRAVAASSCFPPVFDPLRTDLDPARRLPYPAPEGTPSDDVVLGIRLSDGGLYDNLALEPVWKDHAILIASDGGALFSPAPDQGLFKRLKRYATVMGRQTSSLSARIG